MRQASEIWETALGELQIQVNKPNYETWLKNTIGLSFQNNYFVVGVPNTFVGEWLNKHLRSLIAKTLVGITDTDIKVQFSVYTPQKGILTPVMAPQVDGGTCLLAEPELIPCQFNPKYTFETFIVGDCNRLAYSYALGVADKIPNDYNPLFVYGGTGLGKTHLLHAIGHVTTSNRLRTIYVTAEQFTNEFVGALKEEKATDFQNKFRNTQVLLLDDIDFISGKRQVQEAFLHTFKELYTKNAQLVITSDNHPKQIPLLNNKLQSRLGWGLIVEISPPETNTRLAILQFKAEKKGMSIPFEVLDFLATQIQDGIRELEEALNHVIAYARLTKTSINLRLAKESLTNASTSASQDISPKLIKQLVADHFKITPELLISKKKDHNISLARQIAIYLLKEEGHYSLSQIGKEFGNRNHSTILYNYRKLTEELNNNTKLRNQLNEMTQALRFARK